MNPEAVFYGRWLFGVAGILVLTAALLSPESFFVLSLGGAIVGGMLAGLAWLELSEARA